MDTHPHAPIRSVWGGAPRYQYETDRVCNNPTRVDTRSQTLMPRSYMMPRVTCMPSSLPAPGQAQPARHLGDATALAFGDRFVVMGSEPITIAIVMAVNDDATCHVFGNGAKYHVRIRQARSAAEQSEMLKASRARRLLHPRARALSALPSPCGAEASCCWSLRPGRWLRPDAGIPATADRLASGPQLQHGVGAEHEEILVRDPAQAAVDAREPVGRRRLQQLLHRVVERGAVSARRCGHDAGGGQDDHRERLAVDAHLVAVDAHAAAIHRVVDLELQGGRGLREAMELLHVVRWHLP